MNRKDAGSRFMGRAMTDYGSDELVMVTVDVTTEATLEEALETLRRAMERVEADWNEIHERALRDARWSSQDVPPSPPWANKDEDET